MPRQAQDPPPAAHPPRTPQERYAAAQAAQAAEAARVAQAAGAAYGAGQGAPAGSDSAALAQTATTASGASADERKSYWRPVSTAGLVAFLFGTAWLAMLIKTDKDGFIQIIDSFNLVVHEFGHPFFGNFGEKPMWWGGTLAQLTFPLIFVGVFAYQRYALSALFCMVWFFENVFNVARYVADARAEELPLVSPGGSDGNVGHDWNTILGDMGQLHNDLAIASTLRTIGWIGIGCCVGLAILLWSRQGAGDDA